MFKKAFAGLTALIVGASCYVPVSRPNISIDRLYTRETAKATLRDLLSEPRVTIIGHVGGSCNPKCTVDDTKIFCNMFCEATSAYPLAKGWEKITLEYSQILDTVCTIRDWAVISLNERTVITNSHLKKEIIFPDGTDCQKFIDAVTYLKYY